MSSVATRWRSLVPPARIAPSWRNALPLILFAVGFPLGCLAAEQLHYLVLSYRWPLLLAVAIAPWVWWMHLAGWSGLTRGRAVVALWSRFVLVGLIALLLCEPRAVRSDDRLSVMFVVDASASIKAEARDEAMKYVLRVTQDGGKPDLDEAGLMFFGRNAAVELPPGPTLPVGQEGDRAMNVRIDRDATDIASALSTAAAVLSDDRQGRIVLISDGVATAGALSGVLDDLRARGIAVDVLPIDYAYEKEVWLERLELPRTVKLGETYEASILAESLAAGEGRLVLRENDRVIYDERVQYPAGKSRFTVPIYLRDAGYYEYTATLEPPRDEDSWQNNNRAISYLYLRGRGKVLLVTDAESDPREWSRLVEAMKASEREVEVITTFDTPSDPLALLPYDAIVLANVPRDEFTELQQQAMHDAVRHQGSGLLMIGGPESFGAGAWARTPIEQALPVSMDITQRKVMPKGALAIVLHTCEFPQGNTWGKRITKKAVEVLGAQDEVGVLAFDWQGGDRWVVPMTPAAEAATINRAVEAAEIGDMPSFDPCMNLGLKGLLASDAASKHMIIISDGDPSAPAPELLQSYIDNKISVSTVSIFPHGGIEIGLLKKIASVTGGRYYPTDNPNLLPQIFIKEAKTLRRTAINESNFTPVVESSSPVLKGIDAMPMLEGYVLTTAKPRSTVVLKAPTSEEGELDPVLSTWRYGVGASAAFTSDLSTRWGKRWVAWDRYEPFVKQLLTEISRATAPSDIEMRSFASGGDGVILVEDYAAEARMLQLVAQVQGPHGTAQTIQLEQTGPRRYEARFPLEGEGRYQIMAVSIGDGEGEGETARGGQRVHGGFVVPYSAEYLRFRANPIVLRQIAERTGGRELIGKETAADIYAQEREPRRTSRPIVDLLLILIACMVPIDVGLRRVQVDWVLIRSMLGRKSRQSDARMSTLLKRKREVAESLRGDESAGPAPPRPVSAPTRPVKPAAAPPPAAKKPESELKPEPQAEAPKSMTERLLAAKKRAQDQMKDTDKPKDK